MNMKKFSKTEDVAKAVNVFIETMNKMVKQTDENKGIVISPSNMKISSNITEPYFHGDATLNIRYGDPELYTTFDDKIRSIIPEKKFKGIYNFQIEGSDRRPPMQLTEKTEESFKYLKEIADDLGYRELFDSAFPDYADPEERYSNETASLAISAYLRSLITNRAPFQEFFRNGYLAPTMSDAEKEGALLFFGKAGCVRCHNGPSFGSMEFHALGVNDLKEHPEAFVTPEFHKKYLGRGGFTQREEDMYKFKVPQLYNLKGNGVYFHGSSKSSIRAVVEYFNLGIPENTEVPESQISHFFHPLDLTEDEIDKLTLFIEESLYDPDIYRYVPEALPSNNCFPNADPISKIDLNCE